jgi:hypothetical protein
LGGDVQIVAIIRINEAKGRPTSKRQKTKNTNEKYNNISRSDDKNRMSGLTVTGLAI